MSMQVRKCWPGDASRHNQNRTKNLMAAAVALAVMALASPAMAYVVEVTTSIDLTNIADKAQLRQAVEAAVEDVLANAISFPPTAITVQNARVVGDRMYLLLLIVDAAGENALEAIADDDAASRESAGAADPGTPASTR